MKKPLALFQGFHFILLLHSTWKVPSSALHSAYLLPSHKISISTPSPRFLLYSLLKWRLQREQNGSRVAQMRRQSQDMSWGHLWCSTWTRAEVVPAEHRGLLGAQGGGREPLMSPRLTVLVWPSKQRLTQVFVSSTQALPTSHWNVSGWYRRVTEDESNFCQKRQRGNF